MPIVQSQMFAALQPVRPGDLITALAMNGFIEGLKDLDRRLLLVEQEKDAARKIFAIATGRLVHRGERSAVLRLTGSRLAPTGLTGYMINGKAFLPLAAEGDDDSLVILMDADHDAATLPLLGDLASRIGFTVSLRNDKDETASIGINRLTVGTGHVTGLGTNWTETAVGLGNVGVTTGTVVSTIGANTFNDAQ
jgi:hypothetical protein